MAFDTVFHRGPAVRRDLRLYSAVRKFVYSRKKLREDLIRAIPNLFYADIVDGKCEFSNLGGLNLERSGRELEVRFAAAIALVHPECTVGITACSGDGGFDVVVLTEYGTILFDTKDTYRTDDSVKEKNRVQIERLDNWILYKSPSGNPNAGESSEQTRDVKILSVENAILNMCKSRLYDTIGAENLKIVTDTEKTLQSLQGR